MDHDGSERTENEGDVIALMRGMRAARCTEPSLREASAAPCAARRTKMEAIGFDPRLSSQRQQVNHSFEGSRPSGIFCHLTNVGGTRGNRGGQRSRWQAQACCTDTGLRSLDPEGCAASPVGVVASSFPTSTRPLLRFQATNRNWYWRKRTRARGLGAVTAIIVFFLLRGSMLSDRVGC